MKYVSFDLETTGLNPSKHQILEVGAVIDDFSNPKPIASLPKFHCYLDHDHIVGDVAALAMNSGILAKIAKRSSDVKLFAPAQFRWEFTLFLKEHFGEQQKITFGGKNFGSFDRQFLASLVGDPIRFGSYYIGHRHVDPAMLWFTADKDAELPSLKTCCARAGIDAIITHSALDDAIKVVQVVRSYYGYSVE